MKYILILILLSYCYTGFSQTDSSMISNNKLIEIANKIKTKTDSIDLLLKIIENEDVQIYKQKTLMEVDSFEIVSKNYIINSQTKIINTMSYNKPKWYESKIISFIAGIGTMYLSAAILNKIR